MNFMSRGMAEKIVDTIILGLSDRRGLKKEFEGCDDGIKNEIREAWITIAMSGGGNKKPWWIDKEEEEVSSERV